MRKPLVFAVASLAGAALVASCSSSKTAGTGSAVSAISPSSAPTSAGAVDSAALKQKVLAAMQAARQFRMTGTTTDDGQRLGLDIHFGSHQTAGSITQVGTGKIELINPGGPSLYFKAPDTLWRQEGGEAAVALLHDKWVKVPANDQRFEEIAKAFDKDSFLAQLTSSDNTSEEIRRVGTTTIDGELAVQYESVSDKTQMFVAASGPPLLLKLTKAGADGGTVTFSEYNKAYVVTPPPADQTVDFAKLEQMSR